jgi:hypothetical protein
MENNKKEQEENYQKKEAVENKAKVKRTSPEKVPNPVQIVGKKDSTETIDEEEVENAIDELNPDENSMNSRG